MGLGLLSGIFTARGLGVSDRGVLVALLTWSATIASISLAGLDEALIHHAKGSPDQAWRIRQSLAKEAGGQSALAALVVAFAAAYIVSPRTPLEWATCVATVVVVPLSSASLLAIAPVMASQQVRAWNLLRIIQPAVFAIGTGALWWSDKLTVLNSLVVHLAGGGLTLALLLHISRRCPVPYDGFVEKSEVIRFGRRLILGTIPQRLGPRLDILLISILLTESDLGLYSVAASFAGIILMVGTSIDQVMFPRFSSGAHSQSATIKLALGGMCFASAVALPIGLCASAILDLVYGYEFRDAAVPMVILMAAAVLRVGSQSIGVGIKASGNLDGFAFAQLAGVVSLVVAIPVLSRWWGLGGVSMSALLSSACTLGILLTLIRARRDEDRPAISRRREGS